MKMLKDDFFNRNSVKVAKDLIGKYLVRRLDGKEFVYKINETEAYEGFLDKASHASRGKTPRNAPMFEDAGTIYVYFTYGMHWLLNIVCGPKEHPAGVLIRGVEGISGPARLTKKLHVDKKLNGQRLGREAGLWIAENNEKPKLKINRTPRVGVSYAGEIWSKKLYRFVEER